MGRAGTHSWNMRLFMGDPSCVPGSGQLALPAPSVNRSPSPCFGNCSTDYAASLAAKAQQRAARFEKAAAALPPYAADAGALTRAASTSSTSSVGQFHLPSHQALPPAGKVRRRQAPLMLLHASRFPGREGCYRLWHEGTLCTALPRPATCR